MEYEEDASSPATSMLETKLLLNSTISDATQGARFVSSDLKDFFLASRMARPEYMKIALRHIPQDIIDRYNLEALAVDGYVYVKIKRGMYGLKQAAILAYQQLVSFLAPAGYIPIPNTAGMWKHKTRKTIFCICVDDFGIKYFNKTDLNHLLHTLEAHYDVTTDWTGSNYCGLTIDWHYDEGYVDISMPGYIEKVLHKFQHPPPTKPQYSPHDHIEPAYRIKQQYTTIDNSKPLDLKGIQHIQSIVGSLLFYGRAIDNTMLTVINEISTVRTKATEKT